MGYLSWRREGSHSSLAKLASQRSPVSVRVPGLLSGEKERQTEREEERGGMGGVSVCACVYACMFVCTRV